ncbi:hypothetical protein [Raineya sp.]|jgi:hypothetical protein
MKKVFLSLTLFLVGTLAMAQSIVGKYEQDAINLPKELGHSENDVVITRDPQASKKIWVANLIPNQKFYAILDVKTEDGAVYTVPKQKVGNYQINLGCIVYDEEDKKIAISLNNKNDCADRFDNISIGKNGSVKGGGVEIGPKGTVKGGGVDIKDGDIKVDMKTIMAGVSYIGHKEN